MSGKALQAQKKIPFSVHNNLTQVSLKKTDVDFDPTHIFKGYLANLNTLMPLMENPTQTASLDVNQVLALIQAISAFVSKSIEIGNQNNALFDFPYGFFAHYAFDPRIAEIRHHWLDCLALAVFSPGYGSDELSFPSFLSDLVALLSKTEKDSLMMNPALSLLTSMVKCYKPVRKYLIDNSIFQLIQPFLPRPKAVDLILSLGPYADDPSIYFQMLSIVVHSDDELMVSRAVDGIIDISKNFSGQIDYSIISNMAGELLEKPNPQLWISAFHICSRFPAQSTVVPSILRVMTFEDDEVTKEGLAVLIQYSDAWKDQLPSSFLNDLLKYSEKTSYMLSAAALRCYVLYFKVGASEELDFAVFHSILPHIDDEEEGADFIIALSRIISHYSTAASANINSLGEIGEYKDSIQNHSAEKDEKTSAACAILMKFIDDVSWVS